MDSIQQQTKSFIKAISVLGLLFLLTGCGQDSGSSPDSEARPSAPTEERDTRDNTSGTLNYRLLEGDDFSAEYGPAFTGVFTNEQSFHDFFRSRFGREIPPDDPPLVNFAEEMVVAILIGDRQSTGYEIYIERIVESAEGIQVLFQESTPGLNCDTGMAITSPSLLIAVPRSDKAVEFIKSTTPGRRCGS